YFTTAYDNAPLHALADSGSGGNGVFGNPGSFPSSTYGASNYYVDVTFAKTATALPQVVSTVPGSGATGVDVGSAVTATFGTAIDPTTVTGSTFQLRDSTNTLVPATVRYDSTSKTATLTPNSALSG